MKVLFSILLYFSFQLITNAQPGHTFINLNDGIRDYLGSAEKVCRMSYSRRQDADV